MKSALHAQLTTPLALILFLVIALPPMGTPHRLANTATSTATPSATPTETITPTPTITPIPTFEAIGPTPNASIWSEATMLSKADQMGWFADLAADPAGEVHVVWASGLSTKTQRVYDVVLYSKTSDGIHWSEPLDIAGKLTEGSSTRPAILIAPQGLLHLSYHVSSVYYTHFPIQAVQANYAARITELSQPKVGYFSRLAIDSGGRLHALFTQNAFDVNCEECLHVYYRWSDDQGNSWSPAVDLSKVYNATKAWLLIDSSGNLQVVWEANVGPGQAPSRVFHIASYDRGSTWSSPMDFVVGLGGEGREINIATDGQGNLLVAWLKLPEDLVYFNLSGDFGQSWSPPMVVPHVWGGWPIYPARFDTYSLATDSAGNIHLGMVGRTDTDPSPLSLSVLEVVWNGNGWSLPQAVTTLEGDVPEWPRLAIANGNQIYMTWFVRKAGDIWTNHTTNRVWYAHGVADAPRVNPQPWPTSAIPTPSPMPPAVDETSLPTTPDATATLQPLSPIGQQPLVYSEKEYLLYAGISLLPVVILVGGIYGIVTLWRQRR